MKKRRRKIKTYARLLGLLIMTAVMAVAFAAAPVWANDAGVVYHDTKEDAAAELREGMKRREETVTVGLTGSIDEEGLKKTIGELMDMALAHTGNPCEGDYLRFQYYSYKGEAHTTWNGLSPAMEIKYTLKYYDNADQEAEVDEKVKEIIKSLDLEDKTDYDRILAIHDYICINTEYESAGEEVDVRRTAYGALIEGKAVCQGYSLAFYRLLLEAGIDSRILFGTGIESDGNEGPHTWNVVELGGEYYYTDVTWDDNTISREYLMQPVGSGFEKNHIVDETYKAETFKEQDLLANEEYKEAGRDVREIAALPHKFVSGFANSLKMIASWAKGE